MTRQYWRYQLNSVTLDWRYMRTMAFPIITISSLCSAVCVDRHHRNKSKLHITGPFWGQFISFKPSGAYMRQLTGHHCFTEWPVAWPATNRFLNQCWNIVNWTFGNKLQWNLNWKLYIFKKMHLKMSPGNRWPFCHGLNVLYTMAGGYP